MSEPVLDTEQELVLIIKLPIFGQPRHLDKAAYNVTKLLTDHYNMAEVGKEPTVKVHRAEMFGQHMPATWVEGDRVLYDSRSDDGHHANRPWWEVSDAAGEVDAAQGTVAGSAASPNGAGPQGTEVHQD